MLLSSHLLHEVQHAASEFLLLEQGSVVASGRVAETSVDLTGHPIDPVSDNRPGMHIQTNTRR